MTIYVLIVLIGIILAYAIGGRRWLKSKPWAAGFFAWIEPVEITLWRKSEAILWARTLQALGAVCSALTWLGTFDLTPVYAVLPEKWKWIIPLMPLLISVVGAIGERLRTTTTRPIELVELPDRLPLAVATAVNKAEATKENAVAIVEAAAFKEARP